MNRGVEEPLAPALGTLTVARILGDIGDQTGIENTLAIVRGIKAAIQIEIGPSEAQPDLFGHLLQRVGRVSDCPAATASGKDSPGRTLLPETNGRGPTHFLTTSTWHVFWRVLPAPSCADTV